MMVGGWHAPMASGPPRGSGHRMVLNASPPSGGGWVSSHKITKPPRSARRFERRPSTSIGCRHTLRRGRAPQAYYCRNTWHEPPPSSPSLEASQRIPRAYRQSQALPCQVQPAKQNKIQFSVTMSLPWSHCVIGEASNCFFSTMSSRILLLTKQRKPAMHHWHWPA